MLGFRESGKGVRVARATGADIKGRDVRLLSSVGVHFQNYGLRTSACRRVQYAGFECVLVQDRESSMMDACIFKT